MTNSEYDKKTDSWLSPSNHQIEQGRNVIPSISVSTISYRDLENSVENDGKGTFLYGREATPTRNLCEKMLANLPVNSQSNLCEAILFGAGVSAIFSSLMAWLKECGPSSSKPTLFVIAGYHGTYSVINEIPSSLLNVISLKRLEELPSTNVSGNDAVWLENPFNPTSQTFSLKDIENSIGDKFTLFIDATLFPYHPIPNFKNSYLIHSCTKWIAGHSDVISGLVIGKKDSILMKRIRTLRTVLGLIPGSLEPWLIIRSLKTLSLRWKKQVYNARNLALQLRTRSVFKNFIQSVFYPIDGDIESACMTIRFKGKNRALMVARNLKVFHFATSLGGVESLVDYRYMVDPERNLPTDLRLSIGTEMLESLMDDLEKAIKLSSAL